MLLTKRLNPYFVFLGLTISVSALASLIAHYEHSALPAVGVSMDLVLTVPAAWYWLLVRPGLRSKGTVIVVAMAGLWRAAMLFPAVVPGKVWIGAGMEFALVAVVAASLRNSGGVLAPGDADPMDRLQNLFARFAPSQAMAKIMAAEGSVFYYGFAWKPKPHVPPGMRGFSLHERSAAAVLILSLAFLSLVEIVPVHMMLHRWNPAAAWIATGLSIWGAIWMMALSRAFALRPTLAGPESIIVRYGLLFRLRIPRDRIQSIEACNGLPESITTVPRGLPAAICIRFTEPLKAELLFGMTKKLDVIGLSADDAAGFSKVLEAAEHVNQLDHQNRHHH